MDGEIEGQGDLFTKVTEDRPGLSRRDGNDTSSAAAKTVKSGTRRWKVLAEIARHPAGLTDLELEYALSLRYPDERWSYGDYSPRRRELVSMGYVVDSGQRRRTHTANAQVVWVAVEQVTDGW